MEEIYIGCDLHKRTSNLGVKTREGRVLEEIKIKTTKEAFVDSCGLNTDAAFLFVPLENAQYTSATYE